MGKRPTMTDIANAAGVRRIHDRRAANDTRVVERFRREALVLGRLEHPNIVPIHDMGADADGQLFYTMKLVKGRDLRAIFELVERGEEGWTRTRALNVMQKVCEAMAYAHAKGVIHRDLKPANVMVPPSRATIGQW